MATNWPNSVQTFTNPSAGDSLNSPSHSAQHTTVNDTVEALQQYAGLVLVKSQTVGSGVSSVTVTGAFSATFDNYRILLSNCVGSVGMNLDLQLGASGTFSTTGYYGGAGWINTGAAVWQIGTRNNGSSVFMGAATNVIATFDVTLNDPYLAIPTRGSGLYVRLDQGRVGSSWLYHDSTSQMTDFKITPSTGTISGGTIRVYGYNNG